MDEHEQTGAESRRAPEPAGEGVRIIGAEEAEKALETGQAAGPRGEDELRYGDVPPAPEGPRPLHRFPLPGTVEAEDLVTGVLPQHDYRVSPREGYEAGGSADHHELPAAGEGVLAAGSREDEPAGQPSLREREDWVDEGAGRRGWGWEQGELDAEVEPSGAPSQPLLRPPPSDVELPDWTDPPTGEIPAALASHFPEEDAGAWADLPRSQKTWRDPDDDWELFEGHDDLVDEESRLGALDEARRGADDELDFAPLGPGVAEDAASGDAPNLRGEGAGPTRRHHRGGPPAAGAPSRGSSGLALRVSTGVLVGIAAIVMFALGPVTSLALVALVVALAAAEAFSALRRSGYRPATLLGLVATVAMVVAAYSKGVAAVPLVLALSVVFGLLWYLAGVVRAKPAPGMAATMLVVGWVGLLGSYAGALLSPAQFPDRHGVAFLLGAAAATVANDVAALAVGSRWGRHRLAESVSPDKTWEGLIGGAVGTLIVAVLVLGRLHPWTTSSALALGIVVAVVAPLGDLCESMLKRDIGVKDMGSILPGHGGVLDRIDGLLFVVPAVYYLVLLLNIH